MIQLNTIAKNWEALHNAQLHPIESETQYIQMLDFMRELMKHYNTTLEPHRSLWRLAAQYISDWESAHDDLATAAIQGFELLRALLDAHNLTQQEMANKLGINQSNLSRILRGERSISHKLAVKLEKLFLVPVNQFLN
jgi:HTH-type transcriptional regulator / antitoxin HigA